MAESSSKNEETEHLEQDEYSKLQDLQHTKEWLKNQILEYKSALSVANKHTNDDSNEDFDDPEKVLEKINKLQKEIHTESTNHMLKELMLNRLPLGNTAIKVLFPPGNGYEDTDTDPDLEGKIVTLNEKQTALTTDIMTHLKVIQGIVPNIDKLKKESLELKQRNRELMANLQALKDEEENHTSLIQKNKNVEIAQEELDKAISKFEVVRQVFKRLIIGSSLDWREDESISEMIVELAKPIQEVLEK